MRKDIGFSMSFLPFGLQNAPHDEECLIFRLLWYIMKADPKKEVRLHGKYY